MIWRNFQGEWTFCRAAVREIDNLRAAVHEIRTGMSPVSDTLQTDVDELRNWADLISGRSRRSRLFLTYQTTSAITAPYRIIAFAKEKKRVDQLCDPQYHGKRAERENEEESPSAQEDPDYFLAF